MTQSGEAASSQGEFLREHPSFLAVDLGASSGRVLVGQIAGNSLNCKELVRFPTSFAPDPCSGYLSWEIDEIEAHVRQGLKTAADRFSVHSIGVDSWGVDFVLLDENLQRIGCAVCYRDGRTKEVSARLRDQVSASEIYRRTGIQFQPFNTLFQLAATALQEPEWIGNARHFLMIPDYLHFRLCGKLANEYTNATTTQMLKLDGGWDQDLLSRAGVHWTWMQAPVEAGTVLGEMRLQNKTINIVAPATHDTGSAVVATPFEHPDEAFISSGTWSLMGIESQVPFLSQQAMDWNFSNEGGYGRRYRVLKNIMGSWLLQRLCKEFEIDVESAIMRARTEATPWRSIVNPNDAGFLNPASMADAIREFCRKTQQPAPASIGEYVRCVNESLALSYRAVKEQLESMMGRALRKIRIVGGGSQNRLLNQLCADCCGLPVSTGPVEASALGNLCAQMIAAGEIGGLDEARAMIARTYSSTEYLPQELIPEEAWRRFLEYSEFNIEEMA